MSRLRLVIISTVAGLIPGGLVALFMCRMALDHNPQEEFYSYATGAFTSDLYVLFVGWTLAVAIPITLAILLITAGSFIMRRLIDRSKR